MVLTPFKTFQIISINTFYTVDINLSRCFGKIYEKALSEVQYRGIVCFFANIFRIILQKKAK